MDNILIVGDTHGEWAPLNKLISSKHPDIILQIGDFGWWPKFHNTSSINDGVNYKRRWDQYGIKNNGCKIYWCDGNHEDHWDLKKHDHPHEVMPDVYYMPRCSILVLPDGRRVLFMGGASSIDKRYRTIGHDWFPEEEISQRDIMNLPNVDIDIVISHTCPNSFLKGSKFCEFKIKDSSNDALEYVFEKYNPSLWYFGHFHCYENGFDKHTNWTCLNILGFTNGWCKLKI